VSAESTRAYLARYGLDEKIITYDVLTATVEQAAEAFHFETAARLRDQLLAVRKVAEKQNIVTGSGDQDAIGLARSDLGVCIELFFVRGGKLLGRDHFLLDGSEEESDSAVLTAFLQQYCREKGRRENPPAHAAARDETRSCRHGERQCGKVPE